MKNSDIFSCICVTHTLHSSVSLRLHVVLLEPCQSRVRVKQGEVWNKRRAAVSVLVRILEIQQACITVRLDIRLETPCTSIRVIGR